jgi:signal peptidase I
VPLGLLAGIVAVAVAGVAAPAAAAPDPRVVSLLEGDLGVILEGVDGGRFASLRATTSAMEPAFGVGDMVSVDRGAYAAAPIGRGEVVAFRPTAAQAGQCGATGPYVKRVVALGGDTIEVRDGLVLVGGAPLTVAGADPPSYELPVRVVPDGSVFVLGDRRNLSCDSHSWSRPFVPVGRVVGRVDAV